MPNYTVSVVDKCGPPGIDEFPVKGLYRDKVKRHVTEGWCALRKIQRADIGKAKKAGARFSVTIDLWDEQANKRKYLGNISY